MKLIAWNVNSLRVRLAQVLQLLDEEQPDALALQEIKTTEEHFPFAAFAERGWHVLVAGQKAYHGVALITREEAELLHRGAPPGMNDPAARLLAARVQGVVVASVYAPNGQEVGSQAYAYKLNWFAHLADWAATLEGPLALLGDFNVAPEDRDVHDPKRWQGKILCSEPERAAFRDLLARARLTDAVRALTEAPMFTWWDYRLRAFERGWGLRIDHALVRGLVPGEARVRTDYRALERPSDHAPLVVEASP